MPDDLLMRHPDPSDASVSTAAEPATPSVPALSVETITQVAGTAARSRSESTRRNYAADWDRFTAWCQREGHVALPAHPLTVAAYLLKAAATVTEAGERAYSPATLARWVAGIGYHHRRAGHPAPGADEIVAATLSGIRRDYAAAGQRPRTPRAPLLTADIVTIIDKARADCDGWAAEVLERRDSAILLLGFAGAFRRSELVALTCSDVSVHRLDGLHIKLRKSKTDQEGRGSIRALPFTHSHASCPPCAWLRWAQIVAASDSGGRPAVIRLLRTAEPFETHVCRGSRPRMVPSSPWLRSIRKNGNLSDTALSGAAVHKAIRRRAEQAGYDPETVQQLGGHSLRAGFVTQAFRNGASAHAIMRQTGHSTPAMLETYAREHAPLIGNAVTNLGL
ncbi:tyrosine-type recombinase/integrase [Rhodococcus pyridinivorans]|nr:tyrosine-type recombinase/integrase [Rhodococcus pyridinivorans]MCD2118316.1 tyrosine-type recombinase/integrase [Rhodococcus pyridinivorans]MCZ4627257.1 tyrosine-type recombinase/integrase [Rhodococcus pyridinivorans]MCZ4648449.1 tyrosine-type recombinase/integrase [Rhodococcus pyridinivorans]MDJ0481116.1 tyrosine-type recombinase/integrase [Rhodococcus pyridinivorans]MDV7254582.1 tyrosine-type recombinase/integrase [Rhodococcus pyridinivorans]